MIKSPPYISIALISAGSLAYEILLMRLFSIIQWHHFAYMIIALALLGYGASGTVVSILQARLLARFRLFYTACIVLFGLTAIICFQLAQHVPFNAEQILWDKRQILYLLVTFVLLMVPFFFAASAICLSFMKFQQKVSKIYAVDLIGAGIGSVLIVLVLFVVSPSWSLIIISVAGLLAAASAIVELSAGSKLWPVAGLVLLAGGLSFYGKYFELNISPYKALSQTLRVEGASVIDERSSPLGFISVVENNKVPLRHVPGMGLTSMTEPLRQLGVFIDADNMMVITEYPDNLQRLTYLDHITSALPYHLNEIDEVLVVGAGGGADILQAKYHGVDRIDAVEINPQLIKLVREDYKIFSGGLYDQDEVSVYVSEARDYLIRKNRKYGLIQLALTDAFNASSSGLYALNESYMYTTEALASYLDRLQENGYLAITRWLKMPPRDTLKLFATAIDALEYSGVNSPGRQLVLIRSWQTSTLLVKKGVFSDPELDQIRAFSSSRFFDMAYMPGLTVEQVNRYNILRQPYLYEGANALLSDSRKRYLDQYKFKLDPATDDRPYFNHFFKWSSLAEIVTLRDRGGMALIEWGYVILVLTMLIAVGLSAVLILAPLMFFRGHRMQPKTMNYAHVIIYFFTIGLAFLFIEIAFIQKFFQFLHHPLYAITTILAAFLIFAGLGSQWSMKISQGTHYKPKVLLAVKMIVLLSILYLFILNTVFTYYAASPVLFKVLMSVVLIAPLAFFMGVPFPLALSSVARHESVLIPWAWGINGAASVISAVAATLLAIHFGFTVVVLIAALLYIIAFFVFPERSGDSVFQTAP